MPRVRRVPNLFHPTAVKLQDCLVVFDGHTESDDYTVHQTLDKIWVYNLYTDKWIKYIAEGWFTVNAVTDGLFGYCAVSIGRDIYVFGATQGNIATLWKLHRHRKGSFSWHQVRVNISPSAREFMTGWEYAGNLFIFGGGPIEDGPIGPLDVGHLNDFGEFSTEGYNNQLLCFDTSSREWSNLKCSGMVPSPRSEHSSTAIGDKAWLYGGDCGTTLHALYDLYELNIPHLMWTQIEPPQPLPKLWDDQSITATMANQLVFHGYTGTKNKFGKFGNTTFVLDLTSLSWKEYETIDNVRNRQRCVPSLNSGAMIIMGCSDGKTKNCKSIYCVTLEPKTLQQLATKTIHAHRATLPYQNLPRKLICKIMGI